MALDVTSLDFSPTTPKSAQFSIAIPDTWDLGELALEIHWAHGDGAAAFGVVWKIFAVFLKDGSAIASPLNDVSVEDTGGVADTLYVAPRTAIVPGGTPEVGGHVGIIIQRNTDAAADDLDVDARLIGVRLFFSADYGNEVSRALPEIPTILDPETIVWRDAAIAAGGTLSDESIEIANDFIVALKAEAFNSKVKYLLPLLGSNLAAARMPLRDEFGVGISSNTNFVEGDFAESSGLQSDGTTKFLNTLVNPYDRFNSGTMGYGYKEGNPAAFYHVMGWSPNGSEIYNMNMRPDEARVFFGLNEASPASVAPGVGHWYFNRASNVSRRLYKNGALAHNKTTSDGITTVGFTANSFLLGCLYYAGNYYVGNSLFQFFYMTDGTMTDGEIAQLHALLETYIVAPTGR
jgi:hypothetical protein